MSSVDYSVEDILRIEPGFVPLEQEVRQFKKQSRGKKSVCANYFWYRDIKPRLTDLVGDGRRFPGDEIAEIDEIAAWTPRDVGAPWVLAADLPDYELYKAARAQHIATCSDEEGFLFSFIAYDIIYDYLYDILPNCKNCNCLNL